MFDTQRDAKEIKCDISCSESAHGLYKAMFCTPSMCVLETSEL